MGRPMARNLARAGVLTSVWNRTASVAASFAEESGVEAAATLDALAGSCDVVIICVSADRDVLEVIDGLTPGLQAGSAVVDCSTVAVETAREAAARLARHQVEFLDCPVSGGTEGARDARLAIMAGGTPEGFERVAPVLRLLGSNVAHLGPVGAGQAAKATNQIMVAGIAETVAEALAFAASQDLPLRPLIELLGTGAAASWFLTHRGPNMDNGEYPLGFKVTLHRKDLEICRAMAAAAGRSLPLVDLTLQDYARLIEAGHGDDDISSLYTLKQPSSDTPE